MKNLMKFILNFIQRILKNQLFKWNLIHFYLITFK